MSVHALDDRKERNRHQLVALTRWCAGTLALPALLAGVVVGLLVQQPLVAVAVAVLAYAALAAVVYRRVSHFGAQYLDGLGAVAADERDHARLHNLVEGLCLAHGVTRPTLLVLPTPSLNLGAVQVGEPEREVAVVVTEGLFETLSRVELEGALAQQLSQVRDGDTALSTFVAALNDVPLVGRWWVGRAAGGLDPDLVSRADLAGASMTRYPPGLTAALARLEGADTTVAGVGPATAHLWLADPAPPAPEMPTGASPASFVTRPPLKERIQVLREL